MQPREKLAAARLKVVTQTPYLGAAIFALLPRESAAVPTIGVTRRAVMLYNPTWVAAQSVDELAFALVHECLHLLNDHHDRLRVFDETGRVGNFGGDLSINSTCRSMGWSPPDGVLWPAAFGWEDGLVAEEYCRRTLESRRDSSQIGSPGSGQQSKGQQQSNGDGQQGDGCASGASAPDAAQRQQPGHGWCGSAGGRPVDGEPQDGEGSEGRSGADLDRVARAVAEAARAHAAKGRGTVPGEILRWADAVLRPPRIRWQDRLARAVRASVGYRKGVGDFTYQWPSKKQSGVGYGPGRPILIAHRQPVPRVMVAVDTSGSMGADELSVALSECAGVLKAVGSEIEFFACDAAATVPRKVARPSEFARLLVGGGGTDFRPAFKIIEEARVRPDVFIYATDGQGPAPTVPPEGVHTVWLLVGPRATEPCKWGEHIFVGSGDGEGR